jgi:hypothetical protein
MLRHTGATLGTYRQNIQRQRREISQITKKKKQIDTMSDSGANKEELMKQLSGLMKSAGVTMTEETVQAMLEIVEKKKKSSSSLCMESSMAPSPPSAEQELKSLSKMAQSQVDSEGEGSDKKSKTEQVEGDQRSIRPHWTPCPRQL